MSSISRYLHVALAGVMATSVGPQVWGQCNEQLYIDSLGSCGHKTGYALAMDGGLLAVGAPTLGPLPQNTGAVFVLERTGAGWSERDMLVASDGQGNDTFGQAVALHGDTLVVGAQNSSPGGLTAAGSAYVFELQNGSWVETQKLLASDVWFGSRFGKQVAVHGDVIVIAAPNNPSVATEAGALYVFERRNGQWLETAKLVGHDIVAHDQFAFSIALHGHRIVAGSRAKDTFLPDTGAVYVFDLIGTQWTQTAKVFPADTFSGHLFGISVDLEGNRLFVGATRDNDAGDKVGAVYAFELVGQDWGVQEKILPTHPETLSRFGEDIAISGSLLAVGEHTADALFINSGAISVYREGPNGWQGVLRTFDPSGEEHAQLGRAVAAFGDYVAGGAPQARNGHPHAQCFAGNVWLVDVPTFATAFCFGVGCPCGNDDPEAGCARTNGQGGLLAACGTGSVASNDATFTATGLPPNQPTLLFRGQNAVNGGNGVPFGDGLRCAGGQVKRVGIRFADPTGNATWGPGLAQQGGWQAGDTLRLQAWYRTPGSSPCGSNFNTTNGIEAQFGP